MHGVSGWLAVEIVVFGTVIVWTVALLPAFAATLLKGQRSLLGWGFLTGGFLWFAGALSLAPPKSAWSQRFYDEELRARAAKPFRSQRSPRAWAIRAGTITGLVVLIGFFGARPSPLLSMNGTVIGNSLPDRGGGHFISLWPPLGPCGRGAAGTWSCEIYDQEGSGGTVGYRVKTDGLGCWTATPTGPGGRGRLSGCVTLLDYFE